MGHRAGRRQRATHGHHTRGNHPMTVRVVALALLLATPLRAQHGGASEVLSGAIRAYRDLDFDAAARMLRRVLPPPLAIELGHSGRARAVTYRRAADDHVS